MDLTRVGLRSRNLSALGITDARALPDDWVSTSHGVALPRYVTEDADASAIATAVTLLGEHNVLGGWAAMQFQGVPFFDARGYGPDVRVHCLPGSQLRRRPGIRPTEGLMHPDEYMAFNGIKVASIARAAFDEMCRARSLDNAVIVADMAVSRITPGGRTSLGAIDHVIESHFKVRGKARAQKALLRAANRSASPSETLVRLRAEHDAGLKGLLLNQPIFGIDGSLLGIADVLEPEAGLVLEADGDHHRDRIEHADDNRREEGFEAAGLVVARFTAIDHRDRWGIVGRINQAHRRARFERRREWTLDAPDWWHTWKPGERYRTR